MVKCEHGFDHACLICGFTHIDGKKVWFDWAWQEQQKRIDEYYQVGVALNTETINQRRYISELLAKNAEKQKRIDELQARVDAAIKDTQHALRYVEEDMRGNHEFLQMAMIRTFKSLSKALKGGEV